MKYIINLNAYLIDEKGEVETIFAPTFDINKSDKVATESLKADIKEKIAARINGMVVIKEEFENGAGEGISGTVSDSVIFYSVYVGKTGKEKIKEKEKKGFK